jgi:hypothetical protein
MISDLLKILLAIVLGYGVFMGSAWLLTRLIIPMVDGGGDLAFHVSHKKPASRKGK